MPKGPPKGIKSAETGLANATQRFQEYANRAMANMAAAPYQRMGQSFFNQLAIDYPELLKELPDAFDPFNNDRVVGFFLVWVMEQFELLDSK